ncbi:MAG TPA: phosphoenolpyruvate synthase, partial [Patescibacteria group bacterium]|nr:phosphoenolpyruvate synthase [Patescibacteria group bacterium]
MNKKQIVWFEEVDKEDVRLVGGKGANLGEMLRAHFPVPYGFIVTSHAYFDFIEHNHLGKKITDILSSINYENQDDLIKASSLIKKLILHTSLSSELVKNIVSYYDNINTREKKIFNTYHPLSSVMKHIENIYDSPLVAVRSSATAEDLPTASFAGQQETYLNVRGENHLIQKIRECWASLFTERALYYRHEQKFDHIKVGLAAVVQRMVVSEKSGIAFSIDPVTNDKTVITIEAILGLGEYIVQGKVTPDHYEVEKKSLTIVKKELKKQLVKYVKKGQQNVEIKLSKNQEEQEKVSDDEVVRIAQLVKAIEKHYYFPQDIEWAIQKDQIYIVQSRPITTIKNKISNIKNKKSFEESAKQLLLKGDPASPGIASGKPVIIHSPKEIHKIQKGDVLVASQTNPDYVPAMKKASAIVTAKGGRTSHAAIVSRELGLPAIVGASHALSVLRRETIITVNGSTGEIFRGGRFSNNLGTSKSIVLTKNHHNHLRTMTKIYVNLAEPEEAARISHMDVDGIGLLRAEFMIAQIGIHPKEIIKQKKEQVFIRQLANDLLTFSKLFAPRPVIYRATDFKTNEYRNL